ncbi:MAG: anti-sigma factor family protein [Planctomycetota bacterium]|jgi:hypothetical protein
MSGSAPEQLDEQLTAYLDGELTAEESATLEKKLVDDEGLRRRLAELRHAYELLDELPDTPHNQAFTQSTIAMVVDEVKRSSAEPIPKISSPTAERNWFAWPKVLVPVLLLTLAGSTLGGAGAILQARKELSNLALMANLPGMQDVAEWKVAEELAKDRELIEYLSDRYSDRTIPLVPSSLWSRRAWVQALNPAQIAKLGNSREQLLKLPRETVLRLEAIQTQVDAQGNADTVNQTIRVVGHVLDALPNSKRQDLEGTNAEQRIKTLREQLHFRAAMFYAADLPPEDTQALEEWSRNELLPLLVANMPFLRREADVRTMLMSLYSLRPIEEGFRFENQDELLANLAATMSPFAKKLLDGIDRNDQLIVVSSWIVPDGINNNQRLIDTYDRMRRETREEIDLMDPGQSKRMLRDRARRPGNTTRPR